MNNPIIDSYREFIGSISNKESNSNLQKKYQIFEELLKSHLDDDLFKASMENEQIKQIYDSFIIKEKRDYEHIVSSIIKKIANQNQEEANILLAQFIKSKECHKYINMAYTNPEDFKLDILIKAFEEEEIFEYGELKKFFQLLSKSGRQEKIGNIIAYIFSGNYKKDLKDFNEINNNKKDKNYDLELGKFISEKINSAPFIKIDKNGCSIEIPTTKNKKKLRGIEGAKILDFFGINHEQKEIIIGFASTNHDISKQRIQYWEKYNILKEDLNTQSEFLKKNPELQGYTIKPIMLFTRFISDNNDERTNKFERTFVKLSALERNVINNLKITALFSNIKEGTNKVSYNDSDIFYKASDLIYVNPFIVGADSLYYYNFFTQLKKETSLEKINTQLRNHVVEQISQAISILKKGKYNFYNDDNIKSPFQDILHLIKETIVSLSHNFLSEKTKNNKEYAKNIFKLVQDYQELRNEYFNSLPGASLNLSFDYIPNDSDFIFDNIKKNQNTPINMLKQKKRGTELKEFGTTDDFIVLYLNFERYLKSIDSNLFNLDELAIIQYLLMKKTNPAASIIDAFGKNKENKEFGKTIEQNYNNWKKTNPSRAKNFKETLMDCTFEELLSNINNIPNKYIENEKNKNFNFIKLVKEIKIDQIRTYNKLDERYNWHKISLKFNQIISSIETDTFPTLKSLKELEKICTNSFNLMIDNIIKLKAKNYKKKDIDLLGLSDEDFERVKDVSSFANKLIEILDFVPKENVFLPSTFKDKENQESLNDIIKQKTIVL